jgi:hypothetical protein
MRPLFISQENIIKRAYRRDRIFKLAGGVVIAALFLQLAFTYRLIQQTLTGSSLAGENRILSYSIRTANEARAKYAELEKKLADLHSWGPILTNRLPASAVLAAIEQAIPDGLVISRLSLKAVGQTAIKLSTGVFMLPRTYQLLVAGERQQGSDAGLTERFSRNLLAKMPSASRQLSQHAGAEGTGRPGTFQLVLELPANGNYHSLGLSPVQLQQAENL